MLIGVKNSSQIFLVKFIFILQMIYFLDEIGFHYQSF